MKKIMKFFGYESIKYKQPTEFQAFILRALKEMTIREVAVIAKTSLPTVQRWVSGQNEPHNLFKDSVVKAIEPIMLSREEEFRNRFSDGKKK